MIKQENKEKSGKRKCNCTEKFCRKQQTKQMNQTSKRQTHKVEAGSTVGRSDNVEKSVRATTVRLKLHSIPFIRHLYLVDALPPIEDL